MKRIKNIVLVVLVLAGGVYTALYFYPTLPELFQRSEQVDFMKYSKDYVFVGKVIKHIGDESTAEGTVAAQYKVRVERNIKRSLHGTIVINDVRTFVGGVTPILEEKSYQFDAVYNPNKGWYEASVLSSQPEEVII